jgi:4-coumarate--CoA ligase
MILTSSIPLHEEHLRDDVTIPQFILDDTHPLQSHRGPDRPWLIDVRWPFPIPSLAADTVIFLQNETCRAYNLEEVRERVFGLANALSGLYGISTLAHSLVRSTNHSANGSVLRDLEEDDVGAL